MLRFIKYTCSSIALLYLTFLNSAYKLHYGEHGREYFNDDSIFFGMMLSGSLLLVHIFSVFLATVVLRKMRADKVDMFFAFAFALHLGYWIYCANSGAALHEY